MSEEKIDLSAEDSTAILTHVSIPCSLNTKKRYKAVARTLEDLNKKKLLTAEAREAIEEVITRFEEAIAQLPQGA